MNIGEIAKMAGVSKAAVSRYFNQGYISEEKREKIREVVEKTGYVPSMQAQTLRTKKTKLIGVIVPKINSDAVSRVVAGINAVIKNQGYQLLMAATENDEKKELEYLQIFDQNRVDGIVLIATIFTRKHKQVLRELSVPVVLVGQHLRGYNCVYHDDYGAAYELTKLMIGQGSEHLAYIGVTKSDEAVGMERYRGFLQALEDAGLGISEEQQRVGSFSMDSGYENMKELWEQGNIDGVFCATDSIAIGAMQFLKERKVSLPKEVQLVGIGDNKMGRVTTPTLTTAHLQYLTSGQEAAQMLLAAIEKGGNAEEAVKEIKMGYNIKKQESTR